MGILGGIEMKKKFWISFLVSMVIFSALFGLLGRYMLNNDTAISTGEGDNEDMDDEEKAEKIEAKGELLFLLMGVDDLEGVGGIKAIKEMEEDENGYKKTGLRSDTMILCKFSYETGEISMLSIPRDSRVNIRGRSTQERIAHAHSHGGPNLAVKTVKDFLNVDLEYYVTVDYQAVKEIVESIGGVEIDVPRPMKYKDPTAKPPLIIDIDPGQQTLSGDKSLEFLRFRSYPEGDLGRIEAQQLFLNEFIKQVLRPKNITKIPKMIQVYFNYVDTNIPLSAALKAVPTLNDIDMDNIKMARLKGDTPTINRQSYFIPYENEKKQMVEDMFESFILD